jgi:hypothetical protein
VRDHTFVRPSEFNKELLHPIVHHLHLVVAHHPTGINIRHRNPDQGIPTETPDENLLKTLEVRRFLQLHEVHLPALAWGRHLAQENQEFAAPVLPSAAGGQFLEIRRGKRRN